MSMRVGSWRTSTHVRMRLCESAFFCCQGCPTSEKVPIRVSQNVEHQIALLSRCRCPSVRLVGGMMLQRWEGNQPSCVY
eukprot:4196804-Amphidinium_carterae.2